MVESHLTWALLSVLAVSAAYVSVLRLKRQPLPYPSGPRPRPLIGNAFDLQLKKPWLKYSEWAKEFNSGIIYLCALNHLRTGTDSIGPFLPYGNAWRKQRRLLEEGLKRDPMSSYHDVQTEKVHLFLDQLLRSPAQFKGHCKWLAASSTMAMIFGYDIAPGHKDHYAELADFAADVIVRFLIPGRTLIPILPFLKHVPPWVPGAGTQRLCAQAREAMFQYKNQPFDDVKRRLVAGTSKQCVLASLLERHAKSDGSYEDEDAIKDAAAGLYLGGVEAMQRTLTSFILAMTLHPHIQAKAQAEIDRVIGTDRLPTFEDRRSLPYVEAVYREVMRWRPVALLGFPHYTTSDDIYKGFYIPKGTIIMPNIWAITRDEETYPESDLFRPERFLRADGTVNDDSVSYVYGFGPRICPGRHVADLVMWLMIASVLATLNIAKARDENGDEIDVDANAGGDCPVFQRSMEDSLGSHPSPFKCSIVSRSGQAKSLIRNANLKHL